MAYDRLLVQIRERSFLDLLDLALLVVRQRPWPLALAALAGVLPCAGFNFWVSQRPEFQEVLAEQIFLPWLEAPLATAPLTVVLGGLMFGERRSAGRVARTLVRASVPLVFYQVFVRLILMGTVVLYPLVPAALSFQDEVILLEGGRWRSVVRRSSALSREQGSDLFVRWTAQVFFGALFVACFWFGTGAIVHALAESQVTWDRPALIDLAGFRFQCAYWLAIVFFAVARFLTYIDQRIRLEGWEVALRLKAVGQALEARSW